MSQQTTHVDPGGEPDIGTPPQPNPGRTKGADESESMTAGGESVKRQLQETASEGADAEDGKVGD